MQKQQLFYNPHSNMALTPLYSVIILLEPRSERVL